MDRIALAHRLRTPGETKELDFGNSEHWNWILSLYGGEDCVKRCLPALYDACMATAQSPCVPQVREGDFSSGAEVEGVHWTKDGRLSVRAVTSLADMALFIDEYLEIRTADGEVVQSLFRSTPDSHHTVLTLNTEFDPERFHSDELEIDYSVNWADASNGKMRSMLSSKNACRDIYVNNVVKEVHVYDPVKKASGGTAPINIVYNREALPSDEVDYNYESTFNPDTGKQWLIAPLKAWVEFQDDSKEQFYEVDMTSFWMKMDCTRGFSKYLLDGRKDSVQSRFVAQPDAQSTYPNGFSFELDPQWLDDVPSERWPIRDRVDFYFSVNYKLKSGGLGTIQIGSDLAAVAGQDPGSATTDYLNLIWGCLGAGSRILMADGTEKPIEQIVLGERVCTDADGRCAEVVQLITGNEPGKLVNIQMLGGRTLVCTPDHPIVTDQGIMQAADVHGNCRLCTPDGGSVGIIGIWDTPGGRIYNLLLKPEGAENLPEEGCTMFAEGVLVGDNGMQGALGVVQDEIPAENPHRAEAAIKQQIWEGMR